MTATSPGRLFAGALLCLLFLAGFLGFGMLSLAHSLLDVAGASAPGRVVELRQGLISSRYVKHLPVASLEYAFSTRNGETIVASDSVTGSALSALARDDRVTVTYLPALPALSRVVRRGPDDPLFLATAALALICAWLAVTALYRAVVPPPAAA